jgi:hypothetical protein
MQNEVNPLQSMVLERKNQRRVKFGKNSGFQTELRHRRLIKLFQSTNLKERCPPMYTKAAILLPSFFGLYFGLAFSCSQNVVA